MRSKLSPWLARFSTTFLIITGLLLWECYRAYDRQIRLSTGQMVLFLGGAMASFGLAVVGVRERHRAIHDDPPDKPPSH
jgi:cytochrome b subunit of formate dehydrogenase